MSHINITKYFVGAVVFTVIAYWQSSSWLIECNNGGRVSICYSCGDLQGRVVILRHIFNQHIHSLPVALYQCQWAMTEPPSVLSVLRESPKYLSRHGDSSVRLYLLVSRLAWELSMVEVEDQVFPVFLFFSLLCSFSLFSLHVCKLYWATLSQPLYISSDR